MQTSTALTSNDGFKGERNHIKKFLRWSLFNRKSIKKIQKNMGIIYFFVVILYVV